MPARYVNAYLKQLPALIAGEQLRRISATVAGTPGAMTHEDRSQYMNQLGTLANHGTTPRREAIRLGDAEAIAAVLGDMGVDAHGAAA